MTKDEALKLAQEALESQHRDRLSYTLAKRSANATCAEFKRNTMSELIESGYMHGMGKQTESAITAIKQARANAALEKKAENARELGLDYEPAPVFVKTFHGGKPWPLHPAPVQPDWKSEYQKSVELHCITLDELREADAWIKNLEKLMADQDAMLDRQTARIVDLQTHIENFDGEDR